MNQQMNENIFFGFKLYALNTLQIAAIHIRHYSILNDLVEYIYKYLIFEIIHFFTFLEKQQLELQKLSKHLNIAILTNYCLGTFVSCFGMSHASVKEHKD